MESLSVQTLGPLAAAVVAVLAIVGVFIRIGKFMTEQKGLRDDVNELKGKVATQTEQKGLRDDVNELKGTAATQTEQRALRDDVNELKGKVATQTEQKALRDDVTELKGKTATQTQVDNTTRLLQDQIKALQHSIEQLSKRVDHLFGPEPSYAKHDQVESILRALGPQGTLPLQQQVELILKALEARKRESSGG